jgi:hypothetical protein
MRESILKFWVVCLCSLWVGCGVVGGGDNAGPVDIRIDAGTYDAGYYVVAKNVDTEGLCCSGAWGTTDHLDGGGILIATLHPDSALVAYGRNDFDAQNGAYVEVYRQDGGALLDEVSDETARLATIRVDGESLDTEADLLGSVNPLN